MEACIMVIEDSSDIRELLCDLLTDAGYAVALYAAPATAIANLERVKPDLLILDWLCGRDHIGMQVLQSLRLRPHWVSLPVLICSAATRHIQDLEPFLTRRGALLVSKPFLADELCAAIETALHAARAGTVMAGWHEVPPSEIQHGQPPAIPLAPALLSGPPAGSS